jgi:leukotriene-A4 hydrolase
MVHRHAAAVLALVLLSAIGCRVEPPAATTAPPKMGTTRVDVHSFSRPDEVVVRHLSLDLTADFDARRLRGSVTLRIENRTGASKLVLDTRDLEIANVTLGEGATPAVYRLGEHEEHHGRPLEIDVAPDTTLVTIHYATSPDAAAVQWLTPEQTAGKKHPFLFTQSQAILARTWVPCQDTPSVRMTYDAKITAPRGLLALMSAENPTARNDEGVYNFDMPQAIPSYLLALAIGDIEFRAFDHRTGVYAEPTVIEKAARELEDTPAKMAAAEALYGPYRWGRYDIIILPPSFPFGGMENPRLTFATPTILAGDKSLVALVAHELAHSWSGNLVTNATWNDFWLNEGFTSYIEIRIMEKVYGRDIAEMLALLSWRDMMDGIEALGEASPDTHLWVDLEGRDPDDSSSAVAYDKGYHFLRLIEETVGRERFDVFFRAWFDSHAFQSVTTSDFLEYLDRELLEGKPRWKEAIDVDAWVYGPGVPANIRKAESSRFDEVDRQIEAFAGGAPPKSLETQGWTTHEWRRFVGGLPADMTAAQMADLDLAFDFTNTGNSEVFALWAVEAIKRDYRPALPAVERFLEGMGRRKFLVSIYGELAKTESGRELARRVYEGARPTYHPVSVGSIDRILEWED